MSSAESSEVPRKWVKIEEAAQHLGVTGRTIRQMIHDGRLPAYSDGHRIVRIDVNDLDAVLTKVQPSNFRTTP